MPESQSARWANFTLNRRYAGILAALLLAILAILLVASARQESQTFDEANHLGAGFAYWKHGDFGRNPEHPPLVKMLAAFPLLSLGLKESPPSHIPYFKAKDSAYGNGILYSQGTPWEGLLLRGRIVIMLFTLGLGILLFFAAQETFGPLAAVFALFLYVFQPLLLGNGNIVTTDMAFAGLLFASVYTFYRFCNRPMGPSFVLCALATCLTIVSKHSGILVLPVLFLLALADLYLPSADEREPRPRRLRLLVSTMCALVICGYLAVWGIYGFRYGELHIIPPIGAYAAELTHPFEANLILFLDRHHLLPEPYLYGWVDILRIPSTRPSFLFGHVYNKPQWFFFPVAFAVKTTVALLVFLVLLPFVRIAGHRRQFVFFAIPAAFFFLVCIFSGLNGGSRYLIPMYPCCILLAAAAAAAFFQISNVSRVAVTALLLFGAVSTVHSYPNFLAYSNELFGGSAHTYHSLTDSDADWGQGLKLTSAYLAEHPDPNCWFDYHGNPGIDFADFGIPCKPLLSGFQHVVGVGTPPIPPTIAGTVLISSTDMEGIAWGPGTLNPYRAFIERTPDATIGNIILVYHGTFDLPLLAAETNADAAIGLLRQNRLMEALALARAASQQAPNTADVKATLGQVLLASGHVAEGQQAMAEALSLAQSNYPDYQRYLIDQIQHPAPHP